jgi:protein required for attachment to host cells
MNIDDLLDGIDFDTLESKAAPAVKAITKEATKLNNDDFDIDAGLNKLNKKVLSSEIKPWLASSANVPKELREKWTKMVKIDTECEFSNKFQKSHAYRNWETTNNQTSTKTNINKYLYELVKKSSVKCGLDEAKISKLTSVVNPVTDTENGKQLQRAFSRLLINELKNDIVHDVDYDIEKFSHLSSLL